MAHFNRWFLLTLALKNKACGMALLILAWSKFNPSMIKNYGMLEIADGVLIAYH